MKRKIYLTISTILALSPFITAALIISNSIDIPSTISILVSILILFILLTLYFLLFMVSEVIISNIAKVNISDVWGPTLGLYTINVKKAFHSELGEFYLKAKFSNNDAKILVYEQKYFYMIEKFEMKYDGDIDSFKNRLKMRLEDTYRSELREINKRKELKNKWKNWSGAVDKQSEREMKLNSILNSNS